MPNRTTRERRIPTPPCVVLAQPRYPNLDVLDIDRRERSIAAKVFDGALQAALDAAKSPVGRLTVDLLPPKVVLGVLAKACDESSADVGDPALDRFQLFDARRGEGVGDVRIIGRAGGAERLQRFELPADVSEIAVESASLLVTRESFVRESLDLLRLVGTPT